MPRFGTCLLSACVLLVPLASRAGASQPCPVFTTISASEDHAVAAGPSGLWAWGDNTHGQLGNGTTIRELHAVQILGPGVTAVSTSSHTLAVQHGTVWAWGANGRGQLGDGTRSDFRTTPAPVPGLSGVTSVAAGSQFSLAVGPGGQVWAWGNNFPWGELGDGTDQGRFVPGLVPGLPPVVSVSAGDAYGLAVGADGSLWAWGDNRYGQLGDGTLTNRRTPFQVPGLPPIRAAYGANQGHSFAVDVTGRLWGWGGRWAASGTGAWSASPQQVTGVTGYAGSAAGGPFHSLAASWGGPVWAWGENMDGELGDGDAGGHYQEFPRPVPGLTGIVRVAANGTHSMALGAGGTVWGWGNNFYGQVGDDTTAEKLVPVPLHCG